MIPFYRKQADSNPLEENLPWSHGLVLVPKNENKGFPCPLAYFDPSNNLGWEMGLMYSDLLLADEETGSEG